MIIRYLKHPFLVVFIFLSVIARAQQGNYFLDQQMQNVIESGVYSKKSTVHTSIRPYRYDEVAQEVNMDSILSLTSDSNRLYLLPSSWWAKLFIWGEKKLFDEDFLNIDSSGFQMRVNGLVDLRLGRDLENEGVYTWKNTRGYWIEGNFNQKVFFNSVLYENQALFLPHVGRYANSSNVIPGQGRYKNFREDITSGALDWGFSMGAVSYRPNHFFNFEFGHGKHFLGDGYRSLLLSDHAAPSVYFKGEANFWKMKYFVLFQRNNHFGFGAQADRLLDAKFNAIHYLSWNINKRLNISLFENITWKVTETRSFDWNYANPVVVMRSIEWQTGSVDRAMLGANSSYKLTDKITLFGQFVLDDLNIQALKKLNNYWGNKNGFQLGTKVFDVFGLEGLNFHLEYNQVRPFTYSHFDEITSHSQMNEPLAHPLGANFRETISFLRYRYKRHFFQVRYSLATFGKDTNNINHGGNIFIDYNTNRVDVRNDEALYGHKIGQGLRTNLRLTDIRYSYLVNPKALLLFETGVSTRSFVNTRQEENNLYFYIGLRTALHNFYHDFF